MHTLANAFAALGIVNERMQLLLELLVFLLQVFNLAFSKRDHIIASGVGQFEGAKEGTVFGKKLGMLLQENKYFCAVKGFGSHSKTLLGFRVKGNRSGIENQAGMLLECLPPRCCYLMGVCRKASGMGGASAGIL